MTVDIEKLEALAKAATQGDWEKDGNQVCPVADQNAALATFHRDADARYVAAASPAALLELTQTIRDLQSSVQGLKTGYEAYERVNAELRAECEGLRKDADRYRYIRDEMPHKYLGRAILGVVSGEEYDEAIDAAMSKEASHD